MWPTKRGVRMGTGQKSIHVDTQMLIHSSVLDIYIYVYCIYVYIYVYT